jgi:hypothetical protein
MKLLCTVLFILSVSFVNIYSQGVSDKSVGEILDERGAIKPNSTGSYNTNGYTMTYGRHNQPVFKKTNAPKITDAYTWGSLGSGRNGTNEDVIAIAVDDSGNIYVGGGFTSVSDIPANNIAKWNTTTGTWSTLTSGGSKGVNGNVYALTVNGSDIYVGGNFSKLGDGTSAKHIAKWNTTANTWSAIGSGADNPILTMQVNPADGKIYLGGRFNILDSTIAAYFVGTLSYDPTFIKSDLELPSKFSLFQNYPNPFNPSTTINYSLPISGNVKLTVYNAIGAKVATLINAYKPAGNYSVQFNAANLASENYLYRLESGNYSVAKKFVLLK